MPTYFCLSINAKLLIYLNMKKSVLDSEQTKPIDARLLEPAQFKFGNTMLF